MKQLLLSLILFASFTGINAQDSTTIKSFDWLTGNWQMDQGTVFITEHWEYGKNQTLLGKGYVIKGIDTLIYETMKIEKVGKYWVFIAQVDNNNPVLFTLNPLTDNGEFVFENLEHDSPQRVIYAHKKENELYARTETETNGTIKKNEYVYKRP